MTDSTKPPYILGLDIGIASVGAALLGVEEERIIALYIRTFEKAETAKEGDSLNKIRRESRLTRRRICRRAQRMRALLHLFYQEGMLPKLDIACLHQGLNAHISPWQLRTEGLDGKLSSIEWAKVLYHIVKHRGFQSNRKSEIKENAVLGVMLTSVVQNEQLLTAYRSMGELAYKDPKFAEAKRNKRDRYLNTFSRSSLEQEIKTLFEQQRKYGNPYTSAAFEEQVNEILMRRKPALSGEALIKMVGKCTFEPAEKRAPKAGYSAERFVWLTKLNNLRISKFGEQRELLPEERALLIEYPFQVQKDELKYKKIRKLLRLSDQETFNILYSSTKNPENEILFKAKCFHALRQVYQEAGLEKQWQRDAQNPERLDTLAYALTCYKEDAESRQWLTEQGIEPAIIEAVLEKSYDKFLHLSTKALKKILPFMEIGMRYDQAIAAIPEYLPPLKDEQTSLPKFDKEEVMNPVVYRALNQARKLVNAIIREHGSPTAIRIELARDLSKPLDERRKIHREQKAFEEERKGAIKEFKEKFIQVSEPRSLDLLKYRLYKEQDAKCMYTQQTILLHRLDENGYVEVDHILPYSRSFDDSRNNKVLVLAGQNRNKGNRTPYEYLGGSSHSESWQRFESWVKSNHKINQEKRKRLLHYDFLEQSADEFKERNLCDTRYISRRFKQHIEDYLRLDQIESVKGIPNTFQKPCVVVTGRLTSYLRARWGLIKNREENDLHHALDAAVIAACTPGMVQRLSDYSQRQELYIHSDHTLDKHFPSPWPHFRAELLARLSANPVQKLASLGGCKEEDLAHIQPLRVSRMPTRLGMGAAHKATISSTGKADKLLKAGYSSIKTPLKKLKLKDLENIVGYDDPRNKALMEAIQERLEEFEDDGEKAFSEERPLYRVDPPIPSSKVSGRDENIQHYNEAIQKEINLIPDNITGNTRSVRIGRIKNRLKKQFNVQPEVGPRVHSIKLKSVQKSGVRLPNRGNGVADNGDMLRVDIFTKGGKYYGVPVYVADATREVLPDKAATAGKIEKDWAVMDESYTFLFSLYKNDWVTITYKDQSYKEGYYCEFDRANACISLYLHDRNTQLEKGGKIRGIGIKTVESIKKYHVDLLGNLHSAKIETRQPIQKNLKTNKQESHGLA